MSVHGGYGIYYDRITLEIMSLERGLDGRTLPIEVRAGNVFFLDRRTGRRSCRRSRRRISEPVHRIHPAGRGRRRASTSSTTRMQNPTVQQFNLGIEHELPRRLVPASTALHNARHALHHRPADRRRCSIPSSAARTASSTSSRASARSYDALLDERRAALRRRASGSAPSYTLAKAFNYANDDQIPFSARADRPEQPAARVRPDAERPAPSASRSRARGARRAGSAVGHLDDRLRRADGHPDARRRRRASRCCSATPAAASSRPPAS